MITGASGALAGKLYPLLRNRYDVRLSDVAVPTWLGVDDEFVAADLRDPDAVASAVSGVDGIIHFGAIGQEDHWNSMLSVTIDGTYNVYEAARSCGVKRVIYASSVHAIGYYPRNQRIGVNEFVKPDSRYGVSKCCGEAIAAFFAHKYGVSSLAIRIGNGTFDMPVDERLLAIWISARDLCQLVCIGLEHPELVYDIVYGESGNTRSFWDNSSATRLGYRPQDNAEDWAAEILKNGPVEDTSRLAAQYQGGSFVEFP